MRALGFVFVIVLLIAAIGYYRGWFSVTTSHAGGKSDVTFQVDENRMRDDAKTAGSKISKLSADALAAVKSLGKKVSADETTLEGTLSLVDQTARDLTLTAGTETIDIHVPTGIPITRNGVDVGFDQLLPSTRVRLTFKNLGEDRSLARIEILA